MAPYLNAKRTISLVSRVLTTTLDFLGYVPGSISLVSRVLTTTLDFLGVRACSTADLLHGYSSQHRMNLLGLTLGRAY